MSKVINKFTRKVGRSILSGGKAGGDEQEPHSREHRSSTTSCPAVPASAGGGRRSSIGKGKSGGASKRRSSSALSVTLRSSGLSVGSSAAALASANGASVSSLQSSASSFACAASADSPKLDKLLRDRRWKALSRFLDSSEGRKQVQSATARTRAHSSSASTMAAAAAAAAAASDSRAQGGGCEQDTPLHRAIREGAPLPILERLVELSPSQVAARGRRGRTPLHVVAASAGSTTFATRQHVEAARLLLECSASAADAASAKDNDGRTPLHLACRDEWSRKTEQAFERAFDAQSTSATYSYPGKKSSTKDDGDDEDCDYGDFIGGIVAQTRRGAEGDRRLIEIVYLLCRADTASVNVEDGAGWTALEYAIEGERGIEVIRMLRKASEAVWKKRSTEATNAALRRMLERGRDSSKRKMAQAA